VAGALQGNSSDFVSGLPEPSAGVCIKTVVSGGCYLTEGAGSRDVEVSRGIVEVLRWEVVRLDGGMEDQVGFPKKQ
jgi:hypothetical protein